MGNVRNVAGLLVCWMFAVAALAVAPPATNPTGLSSPAMAPGTGAWKTAATENVRVAAAGGDAKAMIELGLRLEQGRNARKDEAEGLKWMRKASDKGDVDGLAALGLRLMYGNGTEAEKFEATDLFKKAAEAGNATAEYELGMSYKAGRGAEQNDRQAVEWLNKAALLGDAAAQYELGDCYESGQGTAADPATAAKWYRRAAEQNHALAQQRLGMMLKDGQGVAKDSREALKWLVKAAQQGLKDSQWAAGKMYQSGEGGPVDKERAAQWMRKLAEQKNREAQAELAALSPETVKKIARPLAFKGDGADESQIDSVVMVEGKIDSGAGGDDAARGARGRRERGRAEPKSRTKTGGGTWTMLAPKAGGVCELTISAGKLEADKVRDGMTIRVYGTLTDVKGITALAMDLSLPTFEYKYKLRETGALIAGRSQNYVVDGAVKNTGKQPLKNVKVEVHVYQTNSPNDTTKTVTLDTVDVGEAKDFKTEVRFHNYQYVGATSTPRVEMKVVSYDW